MPCQILCDCLESSGARDLRTIAKQKKKRKRKRKRKRKKKGRGARCTDMMWLLHSPQLSVCSGYSTSRKMW
jgi:hypothetical protein